MGRRLILTSLSGRAKSACLKIFAISAVVILVIASSGFANAQDARDTSTTETPTSDRVCIELSTWAACERYQAEASELPKIRDAVAECETQRDTCNGQLTESRHSLDVAHGKVVAGAKRRGRLEEKLSRRWPAWVQYTAVAAAILAGGAAGYALGR